MRQLENQGLITTVRVTEIEFDGAYTEHVTLSCILYVVLNV